jgi:tripartite-type tricarboxylate transporter receptor subunit TctC
MLSEHWFHLVSLVQPIYRNAKNEPREDAVKFFTRLLATFLAVGLSNAVAAAGPYPEKPITFVIGFSPGTVLDAVANLIGSYMEKELSQPIILEHKPGAAGSIGAKYVVSADPDGYTFYFGNATSYHPIFIKNNSVFAGTDFDPVIQLTTAPYFFYLSGKRTDIKSFADLVAFSKSNPGKLKHGAASPTVDLIMKLLENRTGLQSTSIGYKGSAPIITALISGEIDTHAATVQPFIQHIRAGTIRALFVASKERSPLFPDVPTAAEAGIGNFEAVNNISLWAPRGTPKDVVLKVNTAAAAALADPAVVEKLRNDFGVEPVGGAPDVLVASFQAETDFWSEAAKVADFQPQ